MKAKNWSQQNDEQKAALGSYPPKGATHAGGGADRPSGGDGRPGRKPDESGQPAEQRAAQRVTRPGEAGLANENRPGLGTRGDPAVFESEESGKGAAAPGGKTDTQRAAQQQATKDSRPAPREQNSESLEQEQQRSTGMSGQSGGV